MRELSVRPDQFLGPMALTPSAGQRGRLHSVLLLTLSSVVILAADHARYAKNDVERDGRTNRRGGDDGAPAGPHQAELLTMSQLSNPPFPYDNGVFGNAGALGLEDSPPRALLLTQFSGYSLLAPLGGNLASYMNERNNLLDVRAGATYGLLTLHASTSLGNVAANVRIRLMYSTATVDSECLAGTQIAENVVPVLGPATPLDGLTSATGTAEVFENKWGNVRFPYGSLFKACYYSGVTWRLVPGIFTVKGANTNSKKFWCVASKTIECRLLIVGNDIRESWKLSPMVTTSDCGGAGATYSGGFERDRSLGSIDTVNNIRVFHSIGYKTTSNRASYKVCYCPGYNEDNTGDDCGKPEDFVQLVGILYATRVSTPQIVYVLLRFSLIVNCGSVSAGGCPLSPDLRIKLVAMGEANTYPSFDTASGCGTAQQSSFYYVPANCLAPTECGLEPAVQSVSDPMWQGLRVHSLIENHAIAPVTFDVCFCIGACSVPASWFMVDRITTVAVKVLPDPVVANSLVNFELRGPSGGWSLTGDAMVREMKLLYDPEGTVTSEMCYTDPQDARAVSGHLCYSSIDCQSPTTSTSNGHTWANVRIHFPGMYAVCYCDTNCNVKEYWTFVKWHLVVGPYGKHVWEFSKGIKFDLAVSGWGLAMTNRLRIAASGSICGDSATGPVGGITLSSDAPLQISDLSGQGIIRVAYSFDGTVIGLVHPHSLKLGDYVSFVDITCAACAQCPELFNSRPLKIIRIPSALEVVIPVFFPEKSYPICNTIGATWVQSNQVTFGNMFGVVSSEFTVCWGSNLPTVNEDFVGTVGTLKTFEPPVFQSKAHLTSVESNTKAPIVISFETRYDQKYMEAIGDMQFKVHFRSTAHVSAEASLYSGQAVLTRETAHQAVCGVIFRELWSSDGDGFPLPKGCFYDSSTQEYGFLFTAKNGLKAGTHYQMVMDARAHLTNLAVPHDGVIHLWSMYDVNIDPFGVIEFAPTFLDRSILAAATGSHPQFHPVNGFSIVADGGDDVELTYSSPWEVKIQLRAIAGANIVEGTMVRLFLWPLTQWNIGASCSATCIPQYSLVSGVLTASRCNAPICKAESVVSTGIGAKKNIMGLTFSAMDPISDSVKHTIVFSQLPIPAGGFFSTNIAAELQSSGGGRPSYFQSVGAMVFAKPSVIGSVVVASGDGDTRPFRGDQGNVLYVKLILGGSVWSSQNQDAGFELLLPAGYVCTVAEPAEASLFSLQYSHPQGRGSLGTDTDKEGMWIFSGQSCMYLLRERGIVYAGSAIFIKLLVNNPVFALQRSSAANVWRAQLTGKGAPFNDLSTVSKLGAMSSFSDTSPHLRLNTVVLGKMSGATLVPSLFGLGQSRNFLSVFFTTEQAAPGTASRVELQAPFGFGFLPRCIVEPLPSYHYSAMSSRQTGLTMQTRQLQVVRCDAHRSPGSSLLNVAVMTLSRYAQLAATTPYGFRIQVTNPEQFDVTQRNTFRLVTYTSANNGLDGTFYTVKFLASDGDGVDTSFGAYQLPMSSGMFVTSIENMLPFTETGLAGRIVIFPLRVPFDSNVAVNWRIIAPYGYEWDFNTNQFQYQTQDIMGTTANLPIARLPPPPALPPKNILKFLDNFLGMWDRMETYGLITRLRVPDATPRSTTNSFFIEFGYLATTQGGRLASAAYEAPQVRALVNGAVDYAVTNLAGQQNRLLFQIETITNVFSAGGIVIEAPSGFVFEVRCVVLSNVMIELPYKDLVSAASLSCTSTVPYTTNKPLVTVAVVSGEIRPAPYEFMMDVQNPTTQQDATAMVWTVHAYANTDLAEISDLAALLAGFAIERPMFAGQLVNQVQYQRTRRDDHPGQRSFVVLAFELRSLPPSTDSILIVKAPLGLHFTALCQVIVGQDVFGVGAVYPFGYYAFEPSAAVLGCEGSRNQARIRVQFGLLNSRKYAFRIEVVNPSTTPDNTRWTISFAGESSTPFRGYRLWAFTEIVISASHAARSSLREETKNVVTIILRPTNAITSLGFLSFTAPFGFRIATNCVVTIHRLNTLNQPIATLNNVACQGRLQPTNAAEIHITQATTEIRALEPHQIDVGVLNPLLIPVDPGTWRLQSYSKKEAEYVNLLDLGEAPSFALTEVFHTLQIAYPVYISPLQETLKLDFKIIVPHALDLGDLLVVHAPIGYDFSVAPNAVQNSLDFRGCRSYIGLAPDALPSPQCLNQDIRFSFEVGGIALELIAQTSPAMVFQVETVYPRRTLAVDQNRFHGDHLRGSAVLSSKTVQGMVVTPRLQSLSVVRGDQMIAVSSLSSITLAFSPSQVADGLYITTIASTGNQHDLDARFMLLHVKVAGFVENTVVDPLAVIEQTNVSVGLEVQLLDGFAYSFQLTHIINPKSPGSALWTLTTYTKPSLLPAPTEVVTCGVIAGDGCRWILSDANRRDRSQGIVGPPTFSRITFDATHTILTSAFFDIDGTELLIAFSVSPTFISAGQFLLLYAPYGYSFVDRTLTPGDGFPLMSAAIVRGVVSGTVVAPNDPLTGRVYTTQILTQIRPSQIIKFSVRVNTPRTPEDLAIWETENSKTWLLIAAIDEAGSQPSASNDGLFPGFELKASFGSSAVNPEANGVSPFKKIIVKISSSPESKLMSLDDDGTVHVRVTAPSGFQFARGCLAISPNRAYKTCAGDGPIAVLACHGREFSRGSIVVDLSITNAGLTPALNDWVLESFVDACPGLVKDSDACSLVVKDMSEVRSRQRSVLTGYVIRELIQATVGANSQRGWITTVFVWFVATYFIDVGGVLEIHAPSTYELRCTPQVEYISLPAGKCEQKGLDGITDHRYLALTLTLSNQLIQPNVAYEFGVPAINPMQTPISNYWGIVFKSKVSAGNAENLEVVDASMKLEGYHLTDYMLMVESLLASSTEPSVVNFVRLTLTFQKTLPMGLVQHMTIVAPTSVKVLCQQFKDLTQAGSTSAKMPLDGDGGSYGTHSCQFPHTITFHFLTNRDIKAGSYVLQIGVLNPATRPDRDLWEVELIGPPPAGSATTTPAPPLPSFVAVEGLNSTSAPPPPARLLSSFTNASSSSVVLVTNWRQATAVLRIQVRGYGISGAFAANTPQPVPMAANGGRRGAFATAFWWQLLSALLVAALGAAPSQASQVAGRQYWH